MASDDLLTPIAPLGAPRPVRREDERRSREPARDTKPRRRRTRRRGDEDPHHIDEYA